METAYNLDSYRRRSERKNYLKEVSFSTGSKIFPATIKNLSLGGAQISTRRISSVRKGAIIIISIPFAKKQGCMKSKAIVTWVKNDEFGIQFI
jgi:hypothetical protein